MFQAFYKGKNKQVKGKQQNDISIGNALVLYDTMFRCLHLYLNLLTVTAATTDLNVVRSIFIINFPKMTHGSW